MQFQCNKLIKKSEYTLSDQETGHTRFQAFSQKLTEMLEEIFLNSVNVMNILEIIFFSKNLVTWI